MSKNYYQKYNQPISFNFKKILIIGGIFFVIFGSIAGYTIYSNLTAPPPDIIKITQNHDELGREHIPNPNVALNGKALPRTSGDHNENPLPWQTYSDTQVDEDRAVHNLEHGGIVVYFDENKVTTKEKENLKRLASTGSYIISPYKGLVAKFVLLAWNKSVTLENYNENSIKDFYKAWKNQSPEKLA